MTGCQPVTSVVVWATLLVTMDIDWHIGDVIAKLRNKRRLNQTALALKVGVNKATIVRAEDGDPKVSRSTYMKIARVLGTDIASLEVEAARLESGGAHGNSQSGVQIREPEPVGHVGTTDKRGGDGLALTVPSHEQTHPVPDAARAKNRPPSVVIDHITREGEPQPAKHQVGKSPRPARAVREYVAAPRAATAGRRSRPSKHRR